MEINIYGRPNCQWCDAAKDFLNRRGWNYTYRNLFAMAPTEAQSVITESGMKSVPIVKVGDIYIGGYDQLEAYIHGIEQRAM